MSEPDHQIPCEDDKWSAWSLDVDARKSAAARRRRGVLIGSGVIAAALVATLAIRELPARPPAAPLVPYVAGVSVTDYSLTRLRGGCEVWIGFLKNSGSTSVGLERAQILGKDNLTVNEIALVPATPAKSGVVMLGCQHVDRYPITPTGAHRVLFRRGALLAPKRSYAVVLDIRLRPGARLVDGSIDGVRFGYTYQGWAYTTETSGGRFCTSRSNPDGTGCPAAPHP